ncbi:MAG: hypothetical protein N3B13_12890, partial [Deltaproteobacteria bacterium]|nr:hypothetical protein [Deltaproteobacteria bacterium]
MSASGFIAALILGCSCERKKTKRSFKEMVESINATENTGFEPSYVKLHKSGELRRRAEELLKSLGECRLCPRDCGADRKSGEPGVCRAPYDVYISSFHPHFGEEPPLVGSYGSGTIFFTHCSLRCVFCINWQISQGGEGQPTTIEELAEMMLRLQKLGCHNI